ncbi:unnamed protein product [Symbiodinium natans]|uniref:Uncharacterized protein n=1 Tax=Symbiodinium natans TaxID=878477 RepID=A0A812P2D3_9DINO|nr:unnamed protein product [Symbiodinium natans]
MREQLQQYEHRYDEILQQGRILEEQLSVAKAELSKAEAELQVARAGYQELEAALTSCRGDNNLLNFQNTQLRSCKSKTARFRDFARLLQAPRVLGLRLQRLLLASQISRRYLRQVHALDNSGAPSLPQVVNESAPCPPATVPPATVTDPRVDQLIDVVQQMLAQRNGTDPGCNDASPVHEIEEPERQEKHIVDSRALLHLKLEPVPSDAAGFRAWKNSLLVQIAKLDMSGEGLVVAWLSRSFTAEKEELTESGLLPRLDAWIAGEMTSMRVLKQVTELAQEVIAYVELCGQTGSQPKGRYMLALLARHFSIDRVRGTVLTASTLFQVEIGGNSIRDLRDFVQRVRTVLYSIPIGQRPDDRLTGEWLFHRVKHIRKLERVIDDIRESAPESRRREWSYLWNKIQDVIVQEREDTNAQSVIKSLQIAAPQAKDGIWLHARRGAVAKAVVAMIAASSVCNIPGGNAFSVGWAADTAAGRHLGSARALADRGIPSESYRSFLAHSASLVTFHAGGGPQPGSQSLGFASDNMPLAIHYMLDNCPVVRSTGLDVESGKAFIWLPGSLPFFAHDLSKLRVDCAEEAKLYAKRTDEHVPIFTSKCQFVHGLAASADSLDESGEECQEPSRPVAHDPAEEYAKDLLTKRGDIQPNQVRKIFGLMKRGSASRGIEPSDDSSFAVGCFCRGGVVGLLKSKKGVIRFSAKDRLRATKPWTGDRLVMVLCAAKDPASLEHDVLDALIGVGFLLDNLPLVDVIPAEVDSSEIPSSSSGGLPKEHLIEASPDGPAASALPEGDKPLDLSPPGFPVVDDAHVSDRVRKLRDEAVSVKHRFFHFPKNPFCDVCNQSKLLSRRVCRKPRDEDSEPALLEASEFGEVFAADHIHVFKSLSDSNAPGREYVVFEQCPVQ